MPKYGRKSGIYLTIIIRIKNSTRSDFEILISDWF